MDRWKKKKYETEKKKATNLALKNAKTRAKKVSEEHMKTIMATKKCLHKECKILEVDKKQTVFNGVKLGEPFMIGRFVYAFAYSFWKSNPVCKKPAEGAKKKVSFVPWREIFDNFVLVPNSDIKINKLKPIATLGNLGIVNKKFSNKF